MQRHRAGDASSESDATVDAEFRIHARQMRPYSEWADAQAATDGSLVEALCNQHSDLQLASRQHVSYGRVLRLYMIWHDDDHAPWLRRLYWPKVRK
jgi:hypothetical protein